MPHQSRETRIPGTCRSSHRTGSRRYMCMVGRGRCVVAGLLTLALVTTLLVSVTGSRIDVQAAASVVSPPWSTSGLGFPIYYDYSNNQPGEYGIDVPLAAGTEIDTPNAGSVTKPAYGTRKRRWRPIATQ